MLTKTEQIKVKAELASLTGVLISQVSLLESTPYGDGSMEGFLFKVRHNAALHVEYLADVKYVRSLGKLIGCIATGLQVFEINRPE